MAKNKLNKNWLHDHINDPYVKLAQKEGYRARAAYKLKEIDESEKLIRPGQIVVDLGSTPGSWSQYVRQKLSGAENGGINGTIIGLDMLPMEPIADVHFILGDFREESILAQLEVILAGRKVDLVLSDMAPNLSGIAIADAARVEHIIDLAVEFARAHMKPSGSLLVNWWKSSGRNLKLSSRKSQKPAAINRQRFSCLVNR
jgi:23S rRNA (uridine2552-2'-O)-methyltransferase